VQQPGALGQGTLVFRAGVGEQTAGHRPALGPHLLRQRFEAPAEAVEDLPDMRSDERLVRDDREQHGVGHDLRREAGMPGRDAERRLVFAYGTDQAADPVPDVTAASDLSQVPLPAPVDPLTVLVRHRPHQTGLAAEVVADGGDVALPRRLADLAVRDRREPVFGEEPLSGGHDRLAGLTAPAAPDLSHSRPPRLRRSYCLRAVKPRFRYKSIN
jgi:hypothetical protein